MFNYEVLDLDSTQIRFHFPDIDKTVTHIPTSTPSDLTESEIDKIAQDVYDQY